MQRILIATDMSARSVRAMERGFALATQLGARAQVVSVVDDAMTPTLARSLADEAAAVLKAEATEMAHGAPCDWESSVVVADPVFAILEAAELYEADLLVLGLHRPRSLMEHLRETTMERLVRMCRAPVLLVRDDTKGPYRRVLGPVDFSPASGMAALAARRIAPQADIRLVHAFHAVHPGAGDNSDAAPFQHDAENEAAAWIARHPGLEKLSAPAMIEGPVEGVIAGEVARLQPDLLAVGTHARGPLARMLVGSVAAPLIRTPPCDVLVSHP